MKKGIYRLYCKEYGFWHKTKYTGSRRELSYVGALYLSKSDKKGYAVMIKPEKQAN